MQPQRPPRRHHDPDRLPARPARVGAVSTLQWTQVHFTSANLDVRRSAKTAAPATHPLTGLELRALRRLKREQEPASQFVFVSERGAPFSTEGFARLLQRAAKAAGMTIKVHPHMLRHACGFKLANDGRRYPALQSVPRAQEHPAHGALHRASAGPVQGLLAGLRAMGEIDDNDLNLANRMAAGVLNNPEDPDRPLSAKRLRERNERLDRKNPRWREDWPRQTCGAFRLCRKTSGDGGKSTRRN